MAVDSKITFQRQNFIGGGSKRDDPGAWKIAERMESDVRRYLATRFTVEDIPYDRDALFKITPSGFNSLQRLDNFLRALPREKIGAFVMIREYSAPKTGFRGIGLYHDRQTGEKLPILWASYEITVIDSKTLKTIGYTTSRIQFRADTEPEFPALLASRNLMLNSDLSLNDKQLVELRSGVFRLVPLSLVEALRSLELGISLPPVADRALLPTNEADLPLPEVKSVAVLSSIGRNLELIRWGFGTYFNTHVELDVSDWRIDDMIETRARELLGKRFAIKDLTVDRLALTKSRLMDDKKKFNPEFPALGRTSEIDAYVVFVRLPQRPDNQPAPGWAEESGLGVWNNNNDNKAFIFAHYAVAVLDARTLKVLRVQAATMSPKYPTDTSYLSTNDDLWPVSNTQLSPNQSEKIQSTLETILKDSVDETLLRMGITGLTISEGWPLPPEAQIQ